MEASKLEKDVEDDFGEGKFGPYQKCLWDLMEKPDTSLAAKEIIFFCEFFSRNFVDSRSICFFDRSKEQTCILR